MATIDRIAVTRKAQNMLSAGQAVEAAKLFSDIVAAHPRRPDAHNNLAVALKAAGRLHEARDEYRRALKLDPSYRMARLNLGRLTRQLGRHDEALDCLAHLLREPPVDRAAVRAACATMDEMKFQNPSPVARRILLSLFQRNDHDLQSLTPTVLRLLRTNRRISGVLDAAVTIYPNGTPALSLLSREIADPLFIAALTWTILPDRAVEAWITLARREALSQSADGRLPKAGVDLLWALAAQCQTTGFSQFTTDAELALSQTLAKSITPERPAHIAIAAMFLPLADIPAARKLYEHSEYDPSDRSPRTAVLQRGIAEPDAEARIAATLDDLGPIADMTSRAVKVQYEANPYPKWLSVDREDEPRGLNHELSGRFPNLRAGGLDLTRPRILVAGCGTGRHAISTASRYKDCSVLAVDISTASLAYAARQAESLGQNNIDFARADILELGRFDARFDLIECSGVLHHMADPLVGWQVLRGLLKRNGLMRIGLYSARARARWNNLREKAPTNDPATFIRKRRTDLLTSPPKGAEALVFQISDFYTLSGCRDLLFHTQELHFTLPEVSRALDKLSLDFLGFATLPKSAEQAFRAIHGSGNKLQNLELWDSFEQDNPDTFITMYQFWCQARD